MTAVATPLETGRTWKPAAGVTERGHVVLFAGRGEHAGVYERFGRRLAFDGYRVSAISGRGTDELEAALADAGGLQPVVLAGSDTGALRALASSGDQVGGLPIAGLLLVGVPVAGSRVHVSWTEELDARSTCPAHRSRLQDDQAFARGALSEPVRQDVAAAAESARVDVPVLVVHGDADPVAPLTAARTLVSRLPGAHLVVVPDGRHDVLNDINHRSVAAHVVLWLERLRAGAGAPPIVVYEEGS